MGYPIEESLREMSRSIGLIPNRFEQEDPCLAAFQNVALSSLIDEELDRVHRPTNLISRVFQAIRGQD